MSGEPDPNRKDAYAPASASLDNLNLAVAEGEEAGWLIGIGNNLGKTVLSFDVGGRRPDRKAKIRRATDPAPANTTKVCDGTIYIEGTLTDCVADRQN